MKPLLKCVDLVGREGDQEVVKGMMGKFSEQLPGRWWSLI